MNLKNCLLLLFFFSFSYARATTHPVNDECTGALNVIVSGSTVTGSLAGATLSMPACTGTAYSDIWFKFTATTNRLRIIAGETNSLPVVIQVFSGTCGNLTSVGCYSYADGTVDLLNLTSGTTYYYRVYLSGGNTAQTSIQTWITTLLTPPSNDEAAGAIALNPDSTYAFYMGYATPSMPPCSSIPDEANDQWYKFVASTAVARINVDRVNSVFAGCVYEFQVFSGTPANLTSVSCGNTVLTGLTPGQTYYIRVYPNDGSTGAADVFQLNITPVPVPVNDECTGAINVPTTGTTVNATLAGATLSMPACTDTAYNDIWFKFTATSARHQVYARATATLPGHGVPTIVQVFSGTCGNLTSLVCSSYLDGVADLFGLTPGTTYYYRIYANGEQNTQSGVVTSITTPGAPPVNDHDTAAIALNINNTYTGLSLGYATQSFAPCVNTGNQADDVWYKFVATTSSHHISLTEYQYPVDLTFQVYGGTSTDLTSLVCVSNYNVAPVDSITLNNLTIGNTYYIRVYDNIGVASPSVQFNLEISSVNPALPAKIESANTKYSIYPNPAHDFIYVKNTGKNIPDFAITDMTGRVLLSGKLSGNQININKLPTGSFVLTIKDAVTPQSILFIKEKE